MELEIAGRHALVTGGSLGIGRQTAATLAAASMAAVVHALVPGLFTTRASDTIFELHDDLVRIRASQETA